MLIPKIRSIAIALLGGSFFILDRILKQFAFTHQDISILFWNSGIGWEYFANPGIAFGLPLPRAVSLFFTPVILIALLWYYKKQSAPKTLFKIGCSLIFFGAVSNLIDRTLYHITIDYFRIFTSIINLSDIMIVVGALLLFLAEKKAKN
jgi:lipoprotein signal peptidase